LDPRHSDEHGSVAVHPATTLLPKIAASVNPIASRREVAPAIRREKSSSSDGRASSPLSAGRVMRVPR
jgi:hypothetical protein